MRFRDIAKLAYEAARIEAQHLVERAKVLLDEPAPEPAPAPPVAKVATKPGEWNLEAYRQQWLADQRCPFCAKPKAAGTLMCGPCDKAREPLRAKARAS